MRSGKYSIHIIAVIAMLLWGFSYVWTKIVFDYYEPFTTVFLRLLISSLVLILFIFIFRKPKTIKKEHYKLFLLSAIFNPFLYFIGESFGLQYVSPTISAVIIATIPVFTPIAALLFLKEKLNWVNVLGLFISFCGVIIMILKKDFSLNADLKGILFLMGAVFAAVIYGVLLKKLTVHYSSLTIIAYQNTIGAIFFLPFFLIFEFDTFIAVKPNFELVSSLLLLAVFASSLAYILYASSVRNIGISKANIYTNLIPVFTGALSYLILAEQFSYAKIIGMLIVIFGVALSQIKRLSIKFHKTYKR